MEADDNIRFRLAALGGLVLPDGQRAIMDPLGSGAVLVWKEPRLEMQVAWEPPKHDPAEFIFGSSFGGFARPRAHAQIITIDFKPLGIEAMVADGWRRCPGGWSRADGGFVSEAKVRTGRYTSRLPTNRKRKRERVKGWNISAARSGPRA